MDALETAKTIIPTMNRIDRATKKALRDKERKDTAKRSTSPVAAARYEALFERLTRAHCVAYQRLDWHDLAEAGLVEPAVRINALELKARKALANYQPGVIATLFGMGAEKRRALAEKVLEAAKKDAELYGQAKRNAERHNLDVNVAASVLALDIDGIQTALMAHLPLPELVLLLEGLGIHMPTPGKLVVYIDALELDAMPTDAVELGENGSSIYVRLSASERCEMHLANICAATLRVGVEVMSVAPVDGIDVVTRCHLPNGAGEHEQHPVVHVRLTHQAMKAMDLRRLEPVSTITALGGRLDWEIDRGFGPIRIDDLNLNPVRKVQPSPTPAA